MTAPDFSRPCPECAAGRHPGCSGQPCGCIVVHAGDSRTVLGFKRVKQQLHQERASWTRGGFAPEEL